MRAVEFTTEAFDQPYRLRWEKGDHGDVDAYAKLPDGNYLSIMFNKGYSQGSKEEAWSVEFFRNNSQEVTGEGDAQRVFATVLSAIQKFIKKYKPNRVIFSASKEVEPGQKSQSRARLYDSLVQRYARAWGYRAFRADTGSKVIYELNRINKAVAEGLQLDTSLVMNEGMDQRQGLNWERELQRSWAPRAAAHMAKVVKNSFNSLYPDVPIRVRRDDIFVMATTDPKADIGDLDIDVFNQRDNPNWECKFIVSPLFHMADKTPYLELMVESAASGQYRGIWKLIAHGWAKYANSQLQKTGAEAVVFSVDEDHSDAWASIAAQAGLEYIVHNQGRMEGVAEGFLDRFKKQLTAHRGGIDLTASKQDGRIIIVATSHGKELGNVIFNVNGKNLVAAGLGVLPEYQGQGIAEIMYNWAKELGYSVQRSPNQTDAGKRFWDKNKGEETTVWEQDVAENFADGKVRGKSRPGRVKRAGASCDGSVTDLRAKAKKYGGERGQMYHWCANMKSGKKK